MNTLRKSILIGFTVLGMAAAQAQEAQPAQKQHDARPSKEQMQAKMADMYAKRQARLHDLLKLTTQQESAWATYQAAIKPAAMGARPEHKPFKQLTAPERLTLALDMSKKREAMLETHLKAVTAFYGQLNPAQQTLFDEHSFGGERGGMRASWRHRGHHGGRGHDQHEGWGGPRQG
ncbi:LTXXQ motif family protein [Duganella sacchari]|uniref:LTXXQ motif family protein n=1 Tax=Duganella sacchari TaxID=551987 RepID=A0A1M7QUX3_9BURK|nr:Spy/CpxP family protein refolding chaperone [Duganella sacchari]SHN35390.1 LTXXQ motif family protein [Duganella sacchari]